MTLAGTPAPFGTVVDPAAGKLYWITYSGREVYSANLDGSNATRLSTAGAPITSPYGFTLDPGTGTLYWVNNVEENVAYAKTDGSGGGVLYSTANLAAKYLESPSGIAIDPASNRIYWANGNWASSQLSGPIIYANLDGTGAPASIIPSGNSCFNVTWAYGVQVDSAKDALYLFGSGNNSNEGTVQKMKLDGTGCTDLATGLDDYTSGGALDPANNRLIFGEYAQNQMLFVDLTSPAGPQPFATGNATHTTPAYPVVLATPTADAAPAVTPAAAKTGDTLTCGGARWSVGIPGMAMFRSPASTGYTWLRDGATIAGATGSTVVANSAGAYQCVVTATNFAGTATTSSSAVSVAAAQVPATTPLVTSIAPPTTRRLRGNRLRTTLRLRYDQTGRYSFYLQNSAGKRIPLLRGSTVGTRLLRKTFSAPVVQDGQSGRTLTISTITSGSTLPAGTTLRAVLRRSDGTLAGQSIPAVK